MIQLMVQIQKKHQKKHSEHYHGEDSAHTFCLSRVRFTCCRVRNAVAACLRLANKKPHSKAAQRVDGSTRMGEGKKKKKRIYEQNGTKLVRCSTCLILESGEVSLPGGAGFSFLLLLLLLPLLVEDVAPQHKRHHFYAHVGISVAPTGGGRRRRTPWWMDPCVLEDGRGQRSSKCWWRYFPAPASRLLPFN